MTVQAGPRHVASDGPHSVPRTMGSPAGVVLAPQTTPGFQAFARSLPILATALREAPEFEARRRRAHAEPVAR